MIKRLLQTQFQNMSSTIDQSIEKSLTNQSQDALKDASDDGFVPFIIFTAVAIFIFLACVAAQRGRAQRARREIQ